MRIAAVSDRDPALIEPFLHALALRLLGDGHAVAGAVQSTRPADATGPKSMELLLLPDRRVMPISQPLPKGSTGCCLDPEAFERAVAEVVARIHAGAPAAILSKFGEQETLGRGFRDAIAAAVEADIPLVIGVAPARLPAFEDFAGGPVPVLPPEPGSVLGWLGLTPS